MNYLWKAILRWRVRWMMVSLLGLLVFLIQSLLVSWDLVFSPVIRKEALLRRTNVMDREKRDQYILDLLRDRIRQGDSRSHVQTLLGNPDGCFACNYPDPNSTDYYTLGRTPDNQTVFRITYDATEHVRGVFIKRSSNTH